MNYYGLVDKIFVDSGIYGRKESVKDLQDDKEFIRTVLATGAGVIGIVASIFSGPIGWITFGIGTVLGGVIAGKKKSPIIKLSESNESDKKVIWIPNKSLANNYNIENEEILYGLFKTEKQFKNIMQTQGGHSNLFIIERDSLPENIIHYGGSNGIYNYGLYCEHPKNPNILLPLDNYKDLVKTRILEETIRLYTSLGAREILIEDVTEYDVKNNMGVDKKVDINADLNYKKEILRQEEFGKGPIDTEHAFDEIYFIPDYDQIMSVAKARINGNQLKHEITENIHLSMGLDIDVLNIFDNKTDFKYDRKWHFKVVFYDKNDL